MRNWSCSLDEDLELIRTDKPKLRTIGFMMLAVGQRSLKEAQIAHNCLNHTFGPQTLVSIVSMKNVNCRVRQVGTTDDRTCWSRVMIKKFHALKKSPYDLTIFMDTDVFANPHNKHRHSVLPYLRQIFEHNFDVGGVLDPSHGDVLRLSFYNSGLLVVRRGLHTQRFISCAEKVLQNDMQLSSGEQTAIQRWMWSGLARSTYPYIFHPEWQCRNYDLKRDQIYEERSIRWNPNVPCIFIHRKMDISDSTKTICPLL